MERILVILEVSRKQDYIFASTKLRENAARSKEISDVTGSAFLSKAAGDLYREEENLVYSGGGHTVLQFTDRKKAEEFTWLVTKAAVQTYDGMELFAKQLPYDDTMTPGENLKALTTALETKKALRRSSLRMMNVGAEKAAEVERYGSSPDVLEAPDGMDFFSTPEEMNLPEGVKRDNFIAVIHIDGNGMGNRVQQVTASAGNDWEECCRKLRNFSESIQLQFEEAFQEMTQAVMDAGYTGPVLPIRPVVLAGDDVCFVTEGTIGLECARIFMEKLSVKENPEQPGKPYSACAGVALVHSKYPFHAAYDLAEELCDSAKKFGAELDPQRRISAMDWHIEFGQLKNDLDELREDYLVEPFRDAEGNTVTDAQLLLRPVTVKIPDEVLKDITNAIAQQKTGGVRTYAFVKRMLNAMKGESGRTARGKIKELRTAMKQGPDACAYFMQEKSIRDLLYHVFDAEFGSESEKWSEYEKWNEAKRVTADRSAYREVDGVRRCLFFDGIELIDHYKDLEVKA